MLLSDYIREKLRRGESLSLIKNELLGYRYSPEEIDLAINEALVNKKKPLKSYLLYLLSAVLITLAVLSLIFALHKEETSFSLMVEPELKSIKRGDSLLFQITLSSPKKIPIEVSYRIIKVGSDISVYSNKKTFLVEDVSKNTLQIPSEDFEPGSYFIKLVAGYGENRRTAITRFSIEEEKPEPKEELRLEEAYSDKTGVWENKTPTTSEINQSVKKVQKESIANEKNLTELETKINECKKLENGQALCITNIAQSENNSQICDFIEGKSERDGCYATIASMGNSSVCEKISSDFQRRGCYALFNRKSLGDIIRTLEDSTIFIRIDSPKNGDHLNKSSVGLVFSLLQGNNKNISYVVYLDDSIVAEGTAKDRQTITLNLKDLSDGRHTIKVSGLTSRNAVVSKEVNITIDLSEPEIFFITNNRTIFNASPEVKFKINDNLAEKIRYVVYFDNLSFFRGRANVGGIENIILPSITGDHKVYIEAEDYAKNKAFSFIEVSIEETEYFSPSPEEPTYSITLIFLLVIFFALLSIFAVFYNYNKPHP